MNEKPVKLPMSFGEALTRIARTPKRAADAVADVQKEQQQEALAIETLRTVAQPDKPSIRPGKK